MTHKLQPWRPFHYLKPAWVKLFVYIVTSWEYINSTLLIVNSKWNEVVLRSSFSNFQLLKMIINEQYDLDKAKESVYILQKGLRFSFFASRTWFFHHHLTTLTLLTLMHARILTVLITKSWNCKWERNQTIDVNFVIKAGNFQWQTTLLSFCSHTPNWRLNSVLL